MAKYYPMMLNIENKECVIIGGGDIAYRKILELIEYGASITLVSPSINEDIKFLLITSLLIIFRINMIKPMLKMLIL